MEKSLILIKPDAMERGLATTIISRLEQAGLKLAALRMLHMDRALAERHYAVHKEKPFFEDLVNYITSTPIVAAVLTGDNAIEEIRKVVGPTNPAKAEKGTIRGDFGIDIEHNSIHASDGPDTAAYEIDLFFSEDQIFT